MFSRALQITTLFTLACLGAAQTDPSAIAVLDFKITVANAETVGTWGGDFVRYVTLTYDTPSVSFDYIPHGETTLEIAAYNSDITTIGANANGGAANHALRAAKAAELIAAGGAVGAHRIYEGSSGTISTVSGVTSVFTVTLTDLTITDMDVVANVCPVMRGIRITPGDYQAGRSTTLELEMQDPDINHWFVCSGASGCESAANKAECDGDTPLVAGCTYTQSAEGEPNARYEPSVNFGKISVAVDAAMHTDSTHQYFVSGETPWKASTFTSSVLTPASYSGGMSKATYVLNAATDEVPREDATLSFQISEGDYEPIATRCTTIYGAKRRMLSSVGLIDVERINYGAGLHMDLLTLSGGATEGFGKDMNTVIPSADKPIYVTVKMSGVCADANNADRSLNTEPGYSRLRVTYWCPVAFGVAGGGASRMFSVGTSTWSSGGTSNMNTLTSCNGDGATCTDNPFETASYGRHPDYVVPSVEGKTAFWYAQCPAGSDEVRLTLPYLGPMDGGLYCTVSLEPMKFDAATTPVADQSIGQKATFPIWSGGQTRSSHVKYAPTVDFAFTSKTKDLLGDDILELTTHFKVKDNEGTVDSVTWVCEYDPDTDLTVDTEHAVKVTWTAGTPDANGDGGTGDGSMLTGRPSAASEFTANVLEIQSATKTVLASGTTSSKLKLTIEREDMLRGTLAGDLDQTVSTICRARAVSMGQSTEYVFDFSKDHFT